MGALIIGALSGFICLWAVSSLKKMLGADDSLDVFGVHGIGGILGAVLTGVFTAPGLGGTGGDDFSIAAKSPFRSKAWSSRSSSLRWWL